MKIIGWVGTALVIIAYDPQIQHLLVDDALGELAFLPGQSGLSRARFYSSTA